MKNMLTIILIALALLFYSTTASFAGAVWSVTIGNYPKRRPAVLKTVIQSPAANYVIINNCRPKKRHHFKRHIRRHRIVYTPAVIITPASCTDYNIHVTGTGFYIW